MCTYLFLFISTHLANAKRYFLYLIFQAQEDEEESEEEEEVPDDELVDLAQIENMRFFEGEKEINDNLVQGMIAHQKIGANEIWINIRLISDIKNRKKRLSQLHWLDAVVEEKTSILQTWVEKNEHNHNLDASTQMACTLLKGLLWDDDYLEKASANHQEMREKEAQQYLK